MLFTSSTFSCDIAHAVSRDKNPPERAPTGFRCPPGDPDRTPVRLAPHLIGECVWTRRTPVLSTRNGCQAGWSSERTPYHPDRSPPVFHSARIPPASSIHDSRAAPGFEASLLPSMCHLFTPWYEATSHSKRGASDMTDSFLSVRAERPWPDGPDVLASSPEDASKRAGCDVRARACGAP